MSVLAEIDGVSYEILCGVNIIAAVHTAMVGGGDLTAETFTDALFGAEQYLRESSNKLQALVERGLKEGRSEVAG